MKLTTFFVLAACLQVSAKGHSQNITYSASNVSLPAVFDIIKQQTGYAVIYNAVWFDGATPVSISANNLSLDSFLKQILKDRPFDFSIEKTTITLFRRHSVSISSNPGLAQVTPIRGRVLDEDGQPLVGASVSVKNSKNVGVTSAEGVFSLNVTEGDVLVVSFVGYQTTEIKITSSNLSSGSLVIRLEHSNTEMQEVILNKGYYTEKQKFSVGNATHIDGKMIEQQPVNNPLLALQGKVPGLVITQNTGVPGGGITVRIQGQNSITNGNDPLYVIDGVPYPSQLPKAGYDIVLGSSGSPNVAGGNPLTYINPSDIESIDILKDADATAIYGSRAANGAILITTKKGKLGKTKFDINMQQGWGKITRKMEMLNARQYLDMRYEAYKNDGINLANMAIGGSNYDLKLWDTTRYTNWQNMFIGGTAEYTNLNASISGGTSSVQYLISGTYRREETVFPGNFFDERASMHFNINNTSSNQRFRLQFSGSYMLDNNKLPGIDLTEYANLLEPIAPPIYNSDGSLNWAPSASGVSTWNNPMVPVLYQKYNNKSQNLVTNLQLSYEIFKDLEIKSSFGYNNIQATDFLATPLLAIKPENRPFSSRTAEYGNKNIQSWILEPQVAYKKAIGNGSFNGLLGASVQQNMAIAGSIMGSGYTSDQVLEDFKAAATLTAGNSTISKYKYNGTFGRFTFNWNDKYIINLNGRRDGSSRFGAKNKFHSFYSIGLAWLFSQEKFIERNISFLSLGKFRGSYGTTGNDQIGDYQFLSLYNIINPAVPYQNSSGLLPGVIPNPYLQWEETKKLQLGVDIGFLQNKILISSTFVRNRSSNQLLSYILPSITGFTSVVENFPATVQNSAWEFSISTTNIKRSNFLWTTNINLTIPKNKLLSFPNLANSTYGSTLIEGKPLGSSFVYHLLGVNPNTGLYEIENSQGNATTSPNATKDKKVFIDRLPKFYGGIQNKISFKGVELDFFFQFVKQIGNNNYFNNGSGVGAGVFLSGSSNQPISVLDRWQKPGDVTSVRKYSANFFPSFLQINGILKASDAYYTDASFCRLKNLSLSWKIPFRGEQKSVMPNCKVYIQGQNLWTITNYKGADPENRSYTSLPPLRVVTVGIQVGF